MINLTKEQFLNFIKTKKDTKDKLSSSTRHYLNYFDRYQQTGKKSNWNWAALSTIYFFFFRRMYAKGIIVPIFILSFTTLLGCLIQFINHEFLDFLSVLSTFFYL